jgi:DNA ligase-1
MLYSVIAEIYREIEKTSKRLEIIDLLVNLFKKTRKNIIDKIVYLTQGKLYPDYMGIEIGIADKLAIKAISMSAGKDLKEVREIHQKIGDVGSAAETILKNRIQATLFSEPLTVLKVYETLNKVTKISGKGSLDLKLKLITSLLNDATPKEARYIVRTITGELRLGVADYTVLDALSIAFTESKINRQYLERAYNMSGDLGLVAKTAAITGLNGIKKIKIKLGKPIRPMLAERLEKAKEVIDRLDGRCSSEYKLDGERVQIHYSEKKVSLYPDGLELVKKNIRSKSFIAEAEIVAFNIDTGQLLPFQELMHRRRKYGIVEAMKAYPISLFFFDVIYIDGKDLTNTPYLERRGVLEKIVFQNENVKVVPNQYSKNADEMEKFMTEAISEGCEGLIVKDTKSIYRAGAREFSWIKLKREYMSQVAETFDLVIVGAFYGKGRRGGKYGAFLLSAYNKETDVFKSICKIGTGFSDEILEYFPTLLESYRIPNKHARIDSKIDCDVWFTPQIVLEIIASEITLSPIHTCGFNEIRKNTGLALRFPKFTGKIREDKSPEDSTTSKEIVNMYRKQLKKVERNV